MPNWKLEKALRNNGSRKLNDIQQLTEILRQFRDERDWAQFHNAKDLAMALNIEAAELLEVFLWKAPEQADIDSVKEELADVIAFALLLADKYDLDVKQIVLEKIEKNALKYPVEKSKGSAKKYTEL
ncbi:nucleotide pyrophosphohydrolase [Nitrosomonas sp. Is35]|nr:nucleotide pyrophosphohydrolase [Nitrosomonas sp. Is35]MDV6348821.1 nucleotide pyrophosphohydrolase [Nitrosomonas sp. Is35]